jgi:carbamoyltransferase
MSTYYLGLSVTYHDSAYAVVDEEGRVLFAEATERYLQNKRALNCEPDQLFRLPALLTEYCPNPNRLVIATNWRNKRPMYENIVNALGFLSAPGLLKSGIKRLYSPLPNYQLHHMMACQRHSIERAGINLVRVVRAIYPDCRIVFKDYEHHLTHAALACYGSGFEEAACAVIDSYGENGAMAFYRYRNSKLALLHEAKGLSKASLGLFYMKLTELCGFDWLLGEEWKVMGLASYGKLNQELYDLLKTLIIVDGLDCKHPTTDFFGQLAKLDRFKQHNDSNFAALASIAYTGQAFFADLVTQLLQNFQSITQSKQLTLAGGCALNSSFCGQIRQRTDFNTIYIPPAPADDGCALGAAWLAFHHDHPVSAEPFGLLNPYTGSVIADDVIERFMTYNRAYKVDYLPDNICQETAKLLAAGKLIGWVQGRAEYGPRALGNRSILADPRDADMQDKINERVKFREMFRPFAPSILPEYADQFFENNQASPYMDKTLIIKENQRYKIPAVCHVDNTGRLQMVNKTWNPRYYLLIECFCKLTQIPVLLNTSFNVMGKPLVHSFEDALTVFTTTGLDALVVNDYLITKPPEAYESEPI